MQLYRDLRVLSARPSAAEEARAPHQLYGVADGAEAWSVGRWLRAAEPVLRDIAGRGRPAIVVGGTGLYFRALNDGLADVPEVSVEVRDAGGAHFDSLGEPAFRDGLRERDPAAEARIAPGDRQRLVRAWTVAQLGRSLSDLHAATRPLLPPGSCRGVVLEPSREALYARCDARLSGMATEGAAEEVEALLARGLDPALPVMKALGVREFAAALRGEMPMEQAVAAAAMQTRRYAKRQSTWFRNQTLDWPRLDVPDLERLLTIAREPLPAPPA